MSRTTRYTFLTAILVVLGIAAAAGAHRLHSGTGAAAAPAPAAPPAAPVEVAEVVSRSIVQWQSYSGRLEAVDHVEVRPLVSGTLLEVHFTDGALVKKGDLLFTIDPEPYAAEVDRAAAELAAAKAQAEYATADLERARKLLDTRVIARRDFDLKQNEAREATARVQAAQAALRAARLNLGYTRITAPVTGRVSRAEVTPGNIVSAGASSRPLTSIVSVSPIYATFEVDEQSFLAFVNPQRAEPGARIPVRMALADEQGFPREGEISSVDNQLDTASGTIRVRAVFDNPDGRLVPGLYARIQLGSAVPREALLVDEKAIGTDQDKRYVMVVGGDNKAAYREVHLGAAQGALRVVESGLAPGERIVVNGLQRVRPGDVVDPSPVQMGGGEAPQESAPSQDARDGDRAIADHG